jgi:protein-S-isoprenylcysteine O-methyltransferase Ste14
MNPRHPALYSHRAAWSRIALVLAFAYALMVPPPEAIGPVVLDIFELVGFGLLIIAALGRLWCLSFIAGVKNEVLVTEGPYSVVRNPLYVFNFTGAVGLGLAMENPLLALLFAIGFALFYPGTVRQEESVLARNFGAAYARYCAGTSRWIPRWSNFHEPESWTINPRLFRAGLLDAMWFLWAFMLWEIVEEFRIVELLHGAV